MGMTNPDERPTVALIAGPTASGKTALALDLADKRDVTIINADSAQVYAELPVLSAQPTPAELATVPHRLFGYRNGVTGCSAADWAADARAEIAAAHMAGRLPLLVGGTGLYLRTLFEGIAPVPDIDPGVRAGVRALDAGAAHAALCREDPQMAEQLRPTDRSRCQRALEVVRSTGRSLTDWQRERVGGIGDRVDVRGVVLLPPREWLYARCDARFAAMIDSGAVAEVEQLLAGSLPADAPVLRAIGVREIAHWLNGACGRDEAVAAGQLATRRYAKRQCTWFRNQSPPDWVIQPNYIDKDQKQVIETLLRF